MHFFYKESAEDSVQPSYRNYFQDESLTLLTKFSIDKDSPTKIISNIKLILITYVSNQT
jgi:polyphosphate kinase